MARQDYDLELTRYDGPVSWWNGQRPTNSAPLRSSLRPVVVEDRFEANLGLDAFEVYPCRHGSLLVASRSTWAGTVNAETR